MTLYVFINIANLVLKCALSGRNVSFLAHKTLTTRRLTCYMVMAPYINVVCMEDGEPCCYPALAVMAAPIRRSVRPLKRASPKPLDRFRILVTFEQVMGFNSHP